MSQKRSWKRSYDVGSGILSVISLERSWKKQHRLPPVSSYDQGEAGIVEEVETRIWFSPTATASVQESFHAVLRQSHGSHGAHSNIPKLLYYNVLPLEVRVFSVVHLGEVAEFQRMLVRGEASLRDQDPYGRSLLFVGALCNPRSERTDTDWIEVHQEKSGNVPLSAPTRR
jgi:hypothetical protein